jgi:hypothetical protein
MIDNLNHENMSREISWENTGKIIRVSSDFDISSIKNDTERNLVRVVLRIKGSLARLAYYSYTGEKLVEANILNNELAL